MNEITNNTPWLVSVLHDEHGQIVLDRVSNTEEAIRKFIDVVDDYNNLDTVAECLESECDYPFGYKVKPVVEFIMSLIDNDDYAMINISGDNFRLKISDEEPIGEDRDICMYGWCYGNIFFAAKPLFD